jgi:hypothetical protein
MYRGCRKHSVRCSSLSLSLSLPPLPFGNQGNGGSTWYSGLAFRQDYPAVRLIHRHAYQQPVSQLLLSYCTTEGGVGGEGIDDPTYSVDITRGQKIYYIIEMG